MSKAVTNDENFIELLIDLVQSRPSLYIVSHPDYRNSLKRQNAFQEIGAILGKDPQCLQQKWKNLRDTFIREKKKGTSSGSGATSKSKWQYLCRLSFLDDVQQKQSCVSNLNERTTELQLASQSLEGDGDAEEEEITVIAADTPSRSLLRNAVENKKRKRVNVEEIMDILKKGPNSSEAFLLSFVPQMDRLSAEKQSQAKIHIAQYFHDLQFKK